LAKSESSRGFVETISPEKCFRKTESFLLVRIGVLFVIGSDFVNDTPPIHHSRHSLFKTITYQYGII
ncbi:MAG: hypothetical protein V1649_00005, partial [Patescibacteria group bacterium]